ncbi:NTP phosphatase [Methylacidiphilum kamchatkense Kam1]|uniref:dITP/XTP pyrophosphatase n=1 Tax=Methylacidiphilum kamchatkense Kam1 TaxID=1202785 RepID=A0A0C1RSL0_9BACT|nr:RdgB/HAM1 family non-canonical purine NTP pyrophosphatase [Methylacidiphilum kamchatkense]KIE57921.1 NTP phosphatase [Methylacidiphilum kamchatkense Kam1]QDQ42348.1 XTP/dITP diphosphohydrolase [Methylacidiphilum kamchatkense Kam1]
MHKLLLASSNINKWKEFSRLLYPNVVVLLSEELRRYLPQESFTSYLENARLKAMALSAVYSDLVVSDDSGLEVTSLKGEPGVHSSRYAGEKANSKANIVKLLRNLQNAKSLDRSARFVCSLVLVKQKKILFETTAFCYGIIATEPKGHRGFGYDPIFIPQGYSLTMAELTEQQKDMISHRGKACQQLKAFLEEKKWQ